jgi:hypothetical protein
MRTARNNIDAKPAEQAAVSPTQQTTQCSEEMNVGLKNLACYFLGLITGPCSERRHHRVFRCGGKATMQFRHFSRATLLTISWPRACRCKSPIQDANCEQEYMAWGEKVLDCEQKRSRITFQGKLALDIDDSNTLIFNPFEGVIK